MRLYPPVWILPRLAQADDEIGGYHVPAGSDVVVCPYTLHRHPGFWTDPERFDPERFDPTRTADRPSYAYIPFGAGPAVLRRQQPRHDGGGVRARHRWRASCGWPRCPATGWSPEPMLSLRVRGGLPMTVRRRDRTRRSAAA